MGLTQNELDAVLATGGTPKKGDSPDQLLAKGLLGRVVSDIALRTDATIYNTGADYVSVAVLSGTATLTRPDNTTVVLPAGVQSGIFNSSTFKSVTGSAECSLVIEVY